MLLDCEIHSLRVPKNMHAFFYKQRFFSTQPQCCLTFSWIELQTFLRCCLVHISIIILGHFLNLLYLCSCLDLGLFILYLYDLFFIFIMINRIISWIQTHLFFCLFFTICPIIFECCYFWCWLAFAWFFANFSPALLIKALLIKKPCNFNLHFYTSLFWSGYSHQIWTTGTPFGEESI